MRIATWNVNNGDLVARFFRLVEHFHPHVAVITEAPKPISNLANVHWVKDSETRGIAVYAAPGFSIKRSRPNRYTDVFTATMSPEQDPLALLACWSHPGAIKDDYRECWMNGIPKYGKYLKGKNVVIAGDLNDSAIWDESYHPYPSVKTIFQEFREKYGVVSAYHNFHKEEFGEETQNTLCLLKNSRKRYHIDYVLLPERWQVRDVSVGTHGDWLKLSDHMPLVVDIDNEQQGQRAR